MAQSGKAYVRKIIAENQSQETPSSASTKLLTEEEQLDQFVNLIVDIYLQNESSYEESTHKDRP
jgi:hypothetical protein